MVSIFLFVNNTNIYSTLSNEQTVEIFTSQFFKFFLFLKIYIFIDMYKFILYQKYCIYFWTKNEGKHLVQQNSKSIVNKKSIIIIDRILTLDTSWKSFAFLITFIPYVLFSWSSFCCMLIYVCLVNLLILIKKGE